MSPSPLKSFISRIILSLYYLFLGSWLGSLIMLAISAQATFSTLRSYQAIPQIEPYSLPLFADHASDIIAGAAVASSINTLNTLQLFLALGTLLSLLALYFLTPSNQSHRPIAFIRTTLFILAAAALCVQVFLTTPAMKIYRNAIYNPDLTQSQRTTKRAEFQSLHHFSENTAKATAALLITTILLSPFTTKSNPPLELTKTPETHD